MRKWKDLWVNKVSHKKYVYIYYMKQNSKSIHIFCYSLYFNKYNEHFMIYTNILILHIWFAVVVINPIKVIKWFTLKLSMINPIGFTVIFILTLDNLQ